MRIDVLRPLQVPAPGTADGGRPAFDGDRLLRALNSRDEVVRALAHPESAPTAALLADLLTADVVAVSAVRTPRSMADDLRAPLPQRGVSALGEATMIVPVMMPTGVWAECFALRAHGDFEAVDLAVALAVEAISVGAFSPGPTPCPTHPALSPRESAVACRLAAGRTRAAIARALGISVRTVDKHIEHIYAKLGQHDRLGASRAFFDGAQARSAGGPLGEATVGQPEIFEAARRGVAQEYRNELVHPRRDP